MEEAPKKTLEEKVVTTQEVKKKEDKRTYRRTIGLITAIAILMGLIIYHSI